MWLPLPMVSRMIDLVSQRSWILRRPGLTWWMASTHPMARSGFRLALALSVFVVIGPLSVIAQAADPTARQIGPGGTGSIHHGVKPSATAQSDRLLRRALTPDTRKRLQQAMDATPTAIPSR